MAQAHRLTHNSVGTWTVQRQQTIREARSTAVAGRGEGDWGDCGASCPARAEGVARKPGRQPSRPVANARGSLSVSPLSRAPSAGTRSATSCCACRPTTPRESRSVTNSCTTTSPVPSSRTSSIPRPREHDSHTPSLEFRIQRERRSNVFLPRRPPCPGRPES